MPEWRIDTLDARGGLAFASWRDDSLFGGKDTNREPPCIFIGAPDFRPEPLANRAIALAAGRGAFQTRFFIQDVEASFPTPADVAEFVRRAYLRSGGGDGADGGGGETPSPRPLDRPDLIRSPDLGGEEISGTRLGPAVLDAIAKFQKLATGLTLGKTEAFSDWPAAVDPTDRKPTTKKTGDGSGMLASAALRLIYETIQRLPSAKNPHELARWQRNARRLGDLLARLDLWPLLFGDPYRQSLVTLVENLIRVRHDLPVLNVVKQWPLDDRAHFTIFALFLDGPVLDDSNEADWFIQHFYYWRDRYGPSFSLARPPIIVDPISDLCRMPLPEEFEEFVGSGLKDSANLYHALTAFIGSPISARGRGKVLIDLILFASACIVGPDEGRPLSLALNGWQLLRGHEISPVRRAAVQALADNAWKWLREHLPRIVFPEPLEKAIESTANLRYTQ